MKSSLHRLFARRAEFGALSTKSFRAYSHRQTLQTPLSGAQSISFVKPLFSAVFIAGFVSAVWTHSHSTVHAEAPPAKTIRLAEVRKHGANATRRWVVKSTKVYDITDWIPNHPGGEVILRAVGGVIDPYWEIFTIHNKKDVYDILEQYYVGDLDPRDLVDGRVPSDDIEDPFKNDPARHPDLIVHSDRPFNAETAPEDLKSYITPNSNFYIRHHLWVPFLSQDDYKIQIELPDGEEVEYSIKDLKSKFRSTKVTCTLQCSGNRRQHMNDEARSTSGLPWEIGAISNAVWTGVRLRDVLADAGFDIDTFDEDQTKHVQFQGAEAYGASIPIDKALGKREDVLLVYEMNGEPLPRDHGYPLRALVPGHVAARSVKWLKRITLSDEESQSQWQQRDYKCFGPNQGGQDVDWSSAPAIQEMPVQSAITSLRNASPRSAEDQKLLRVYGMEEDAVEVEGYAFAGGGRRIVRVDISPDDGRTWHQAELLPDEAHGSKSWAWTRWRWLVPKRLAGRQFVVKAVDEGYNVQPESYEPHYNFRGNLTSGWHRVPYTKGRRDSKE
ncbi:hypothetical protein B0A52_09697 [Exophiala mesophila]|uniref:Nitrate reductase [NADPH] n=1 Tax=Exophiala mesophila TaxID=212818 RepID=A0A438MS53_EXOME|nr:hypothetical protein B0A52_09697 [Exophiala mesophila]